MSSPFDLASSAGVVMGLTPELLATVGGPSSLLWLVNICQPWCGFCQALQPRWAQLAKQLRHEVMVGTWDAQAHPKLPPLLGEATNATPTIRAILPAGRTSHHPRLVNYGGGRDLADLVSFAAAVMPSYVAVVDGTEAWEQAANNAAAWRLPRLLCFVRRSATASTPPLLKALSSTLQAHAVVVEVRLHASTPGTVALAKRFGVRITPTVIWLRTSARDELAPVWHNGPPTFRRVRAFAEEMLGSGGLATPVQGSDDDGSLDSEAHAMSADPIPSAPSPRDEL